MYMCCNVFLAHVQKNPPRTTCKRKTLKSIQSTFYKQVNDKVIRLLVLTHGSNLPLLLHFSRNISPLFFFYNNNDLAINVYVTTKILNVFVSLSDTGVCEPWDSPTCQAMNASLDCSADKVSTDCEQIDEPGYICTLQHFF